MLNFNEIELSINKKENEVKERKVRSKDIAIIGISLKLPMANSIDEFWSNLEQGKDCISTISEERKEDVKKYLEFMGREGKCCEIGYLDDIDKFDYRFFNLSPNEANLIDPNQRLFLQTVWKSLEDAGYGGEKIKNTRTGVYLGYSELGENSYYKMISEVDKDSKVIGLPGNIPSIISSRIGYILNLRGPAVTIDTTCSSSLVAVHTACKALINQECDYAIAGGIKISLLPIDDGSRVGVESSNNRTKTFDESSDGTGSGEGVVAIVLKPLKDAINDNDSIYAVINGSAINQDGKSIGITAPNPEAQEDVLIRAWKDADIDPKEISYIETHGTGTKLGDPIEVDGLTRAFENFTERKQFCAISALKSNIGHLDSCSGLAGLVKAILSLKNKKLAPIIHFNSPNDNIDFEKSPVYVVDHLKEWNCNNKKRVCGISSFGISGTNCHVVLSEYNKEIIQKEWMNDIFTISANTEKSLKDILKKYINILENNESINLNDVCYTANTGRGVYQYRLAIIVKNKQQFTQCLKDVCKNKLNSEYIYYTKDSNNKTLSEIEFSNLEQSINDELKNVKDRLVDLDNICKAYINDIKIDWELFYSDKTRQRLNLPTYEFENTRCWINIPEASARKTVLYSKCNTKNFESSENLDVREVIESIWKKILGFKEINGDDKFYKLGGDSLIGMQIVNTINKKLDIKIDVVDLLESQTINNLVIKVEECLSKYENKDSMFISIEKSEEMKYYPLSSAQKRMFISHMLEDSGRSYNIFGAFVIEGCVDVKRINTAINKIIQRHESLRTSFELIDNTPVQIIHENINIDINISNISDENIDLEVEKYITDFDLNKAPLINVDLLKINETKYVFVYNMHHIISDGYSMKIFVDEFSKLYNDEEIEPIEIQYKDFAVWQEKILKSKEIKMQANYWQQKFNGDLPMLDLPIDFSRPKIRKYDGGSLSISVDKNLTSQINKVAIELNTTLYNVLLAVYNILLMKYSNQKDIIVGSPISGRQTNETEKIIGMFVNTLVMRNYPTKTKGFDEFLEEVKNNTLKAFENQDYQLEMLIDNLGLERHLNRGMLFDTTFVLQNIRIEKLKLGELNIVPIKCGLKYSPYEVSLVAVENKDNIDLIFEYQIALFKKSTIDMFANDYLNILSKVVENKNIKIEELTKTDEFIEADLDIFNEEDLDFNFL
ncbi:MAG: polyketide synthase [Clostridium butyricum]|nr:polyketide synthase [Clostridium butyricum]